MRIRCKSKSCAVKVKVSLVLVCAHCVLLFALPRALFHAPCALFFL